MKSPRHQLILLGFICQGLSWDDWLLPVVYGLIWILCLTVPRRPIRLGPTGECGILALGCAAGFSVSYFLGRNTHFFIGHGLALLQAARMLHPLNRREKIFSFLIACFHLGVACTFVFDLRFLLLLAAAVFLIPRTLQELATESLAEPGTTFPTGKPAGTATLFILGFTLLFFVGFPRFLVGPPLQMRMFGTGAGGEGSLRESMIDPARSGLSQSSRVLLQIEGDNIGYLRCFSLVDTDGSRWLAPERSPLRRFDAITREQLVPMLHRRVRVKNAGFLERLLPTDGQPVVALGNFFTRPFLNGHGGIETVGMWNTANNIYEYWIRPQPQPEAILPMLRQRYVQAPPATPRVRAWLDTLFTNAPTPFDQARKLEAHLRDQFSYRLGAPELNRLNTLEDFLFNRREGHCERFAASLALLLRYQNIPSRMVLGYLPQARNRLTGATIIRFKDAHAWTEAWFEGRGWVTLDATPPVREEAASWNLRALLEDLDFAWSSYVVNLDAPTQRQLFTLSLDALRGLPDWLATQQRALTVGLLALLAVLGWKFLRRWRPPSRPPHDRASVQAQIAATSLYGRMLNALAKVGFKRRAQETPLEFLSTLRAAKFPRALDAERITHFFCATRYGGHTASAEDLRELENALRRLRTPNQ